MKNKPTDKWTVTTRKRDLEDPKNKTSRISVFEHSLRYEGRKVHSLTGDNGLTILEEVARRYNDEGYAPALSGTKLLFELSS